MKSSDSCKHISCLFPDILIIIFSYLRVKDKGRVARVCRAWRDAAYNKAVWRGVEAKLHLKRANPSLLASLVRRGIRRVQILSLRRPLRDVVCGLPGLESLNLTGCYNLTDVWLSQAFEKETSSILELNLSMCKPITDACVINAFRFLPNLEVLDLSGCSNLTNQSLLMIANVFPKLRVLKLRSCRISDTGIAYLAGAHPEDARGVLNLEYLCLQDCQKLTDEALRHMTLGFKKLKSLNLSFCSGITDFGLKHLAKLVSLEEVNLCSCDNISDMGMIYLTEGGTSKITSLDIGFCDKIGDHGLFHISQGLYHLKTLNLNSCPITDEGIYRITRTMNELQTLKIGQCSRLTDMSLFLIAEQFHNLQSIDLYGCTHISRVGIEKVMQMPKLRDLNLGLWQR